MQVTQRTHTTRRAQFRPQPTALYRDLHAHLNIEFEEMYTGACVKQALATGCGYDIQDGHTTMLVGAACYLAATRDFHGTAVRVEHSMGAKDCPFMLQNKPGAYRRLGQGMGANGSTLHNSRYDFHHEVLALGAALLPRR